MISDRIKLDEKEKEEQREYLNEVQEELRKLSSVAETLEELKKYVGKQEKLNNYRFEVKLSYDKVDKAYMLAGEFKKRIELLYEHLYSEIDWPYTYGLEGAIERLSKVNIEDYRTKSDEGIWGKGVIKTIKGTGGSPLDNLEEGEYGIYLTYQKEVSFMDLMKSDITREMKKTQYEMYCDANEIDLGIREAKYEELIKLMYRSSEFSYMTGTEKIVNYVDTAAVVVILAALVGPAGTIPLSVVRVTGWYLSGKNVVLWLMGVDVNGDKLTAKQREELLGRIAEDVILALTIWGLGKIYRRSLTHIDLDVVDDVDDALKNVSGPKVNSNGQEYPTIKDPRTGENIKFPDGDFSKIPKSQRVDWDNMTRADFIKQWYDAGYSTPPGGWELYDIHHILPREYGGTNDFWNLVPVLREIHQTEFNPFWLGW